jgi:hypothetical protein
VSISEALDAMRRRAEGAERERDEERAALATRTTDYFHLKRVLQAAHGALADAAPGLVLPGAFDDPLAPAITELVATERRVARRHEDVLRGIADKERTAGFSLRYELDLALAGKREAESALAAARAEVEAERIENAHLREAFVVMERAANTREAEVERAFRAGHGFGLSVIGLDAAWARYQQERKA